MTSTRHPSIKLISHQQSSDQKIILIAWLSHDERSALLGKHIGADVYFIKWGKRTWYMAPLRYLMQTFITWQVLQQENPDIVIVQIPPIFSVPVIYLHKLLYGTKYILDTHSGSFLSRIGVLTQGLHRFFSKNALVTLVPNTDIEQIVQKWNAPVLRLGYTPDDYPEGQDYPLSDGLNIVFICTFSVDEPVEAVLQAARLCPAAHIYVTGNYNRGKHHLDHQPDNVTFTGYIPYDEFIGLLRGSDIIMDLTTRDNTVLMGAYEAISLQKPLITSDSKTLREYFPIGTIHTKNTAEAIAEAIAEVQSNRGRFEDEIKMLRKNLLEEWDDNFGTLKQIIQTTVTTH